MEDEKHLLEFVDDNPDGSIKVSCSSCNIEFDLHDTLVVDRKTDCPSCKTTLYYVDWFEW